MLAFFSMDGEHFYTKYVKTVNKVDPGNLDIHEKFTIRSCKKEKENRKLSTILLINLTE